MLDIVTAAVEEAIIILHDLKAKGAAKMRGISKVTLRTVTQDEPLQSEEGNEDQKAKVGCKWKKAAAIHTVQGNRLINAARRMKATARATSNMEQIKRTSNSTRPPCKLIEDEQIR